MLTKIDSSELREKHWDSIFQNADYTQVLWHQSSPQKSIDTIKRYVKSDANIIDVGCGASFLVDNLLQDGYENVTLVDTSKTSLEIVKSRINNKKVQFICDDILNLKIDNNFDIWHDRAVFHFLLTKKERQKYFEILLKSLKKGAKAIISTFRVDGPIQCAGLDIVQYSHQKMLKELPLELSLIESEEYSHITPKDTTQEYIYFVIQKN